MGGSPDSGDDDAAPCIVTTGILYIVLGSPHPLHCIPGTPQLDSWGPPNFPGLLLSCTYLIRIVSACVFILSV